MLLDRALGFFVLWGKYLLPQLVFVGCEILLLYVLASVCLQRLMFVNFCQSDSGVLFYVMLLSMLGVVALT